MTRSRLTWLALLTVAVLAGLLLLWRRPADTAAAPPPTVTAALPLPLPMAASAAGTPPALAAGPAAPPPAAAASTPLPSLHIGSEGYGPHIDRAHEGGDAGPAWVAVQWLRLCANNDRRRESYELARAQGAVPELMTQLMREADDEARRCQTVTAQHQALLPELAARAMRAGIAGAASAYAAATPPGTQTPDQRSEVANAMRRDAQAGAPSMLEAALSNPGWGLTDEERLSYLYAYSQLFDPAGGAGRATVEALAKQGAVPLSGAPTPAQLNAARLAGQQIVDRMKTDHRP